ncbi:unnamed protein product [Victoria cruziana]
MAVMDDQNAEAATDLGSGEERRIRLPIFMRSRAFIGEMEDRSSASLFPAEIKDVSEAKRAAAIARVVGSLGPATNAVEYFLPRRLLPVAVKINSCAAFHAVEKTSRFTVPTLDRFGLLI